MKKSLVILFGLLIASPLAGCSPGQGSSDVASDQRSMPASLTEAQMKSTMVDFLRGDCSSLNSYVESPGNWETLSFDATAGGEFSLPGDGGTLTLDVIPNGTGGANVTIADVDFDSTNSALYYSGCATLASAPSDDGGAATDITDGSTGSSTGGQATGHYEQRCTYNPEPNPQWDPYAASGVMSMKGIPQYINQQSCQLVWVNQ